MLLDAGAADLSPAKVGPLVVPALAVAVVVSVEAVTLAVLLLPARSHAVTSASADIARRAGFSFMIFSPLAAAERDDWSA